MRAFGTWLLVFGVFLFCGTGLIVVSMYIGTGNHRASLRNMGVFLGILGWGLVSAVGVLGRWAWGRKSFVAWGAATSVALCISGFTRELPWSTALALLGGVLLASLMVSWRPHAAP